MIACGRRCGGLGISHSRPIVDLGFIGLAQQACRKACATTSPAFCDLVQQDQTVPLVCLRLIEKASSCEGAVSRYSKPDAGAQAADAVSSQPITKHHLRFVLL